MDVVRSTRKAIVDPDWKVIRTPVVLQGDEQQPDGEFVPICFVLDLAAGRVGAVRSSLGTPDECQRYWGVRALPGGRAVQFAQSVIWTEPGSGGRPRVPLSGVVDGPWVRDLSTGDFTLAPYPRNGSPELLPNPLTLRDGRTRIGIDPFYSDPSAVEDRLVRIGPAGDLGPWVTELPGIALRPLASGPGGEVVAVPYSGPLDGDWFEDIAVVEAATGRVRSVVPRARAATLNPWSPSGRLMLVDDTTDNRPHAWTVVDVVSGDRRAVDLTRANASEFGNVKQQPDFVGWLGEDRAVIATRKGSATLIFQTLDLESGHRRPLLVIRDKVAVATHFHPVPDTMDLWEPLVEEAEANRGWDPDPAFVAPALPKPPAREGAWARFEALERVRLADGPVDEDALVQAWQDGVAQDFPAGGDVVVDPGVFAPHFHDGVFFMDERVRVARPSDPDVEERMVSALYQFSCGWTGSAGTGVSTPRRSASGSTRVTSTSTTTMRTPPPCLMVGRRR